MQYVLKQWVSVRFRKYTRFKISLGPKPNTFVQMSGRQNSTPVALFSSASACTRTSRRTGCARAVALLNGAQPWRFSSFMNESSAMRPWKKKKERKRKRRTTPSALFRLTKLRSFKTEASMLPFVFLCFLKHSHMFSRELRVICASHENQYRAPKGLKSKL